MHDRRVPDARCVRLNESSEPTVFNPNQGEPRWKSKPRHEGTLRLHGLLARCLLHDRAMDWMGPLPSGLSHLCHLRNRAGLVVVDAAKLGLEPGQIPVLEGEPMNRFAALPLKPGSTELGGTPRRRPTQTPHGCNRSLWRSSSASPSSAYRGVLQRHEVQE